MLEQQDLLVKLPSLPFYFRLPLSFFLENEERERKREAVRVSGCWLQESEGREREWKWYTSVQTLPERLNAHTPRHLLHRGWVDCRQQASLNASAVGSMRSNLIQKERMDTHTHTAAALCVVQG